MKEESFQDTNVYDDDAPDGDREKYVLLRDKSEKRKFGGPKRG